MTKSQIKAVEPSSEDGDKKLPTPIPKPAPAPAKLQDATPPPPGAIRLAGTARLRGRHIWTAASFVICVVLPALAATIYLYIFAADQYVSRAGFTVRVEAGPSASDVLGGLSLGLGQIGSGSSSDTDILFEFIQSESMVRKVDARLNLAEIYSKPEQDPYFSIGENPSIEELSNYWRGMVKVFHDDGKGLMELRVHAFTPEDAQAIAQAIFAESSLMINELSDIAQEDATRYAREDLERAIEGLKEARQAMTAFRSLHQIADPEAEIGVQTGLMTALQEQLSSELIQYDLLLRQSTRDNPRIEQSELRIEIIRNRIEQERLKFGAADPDSEDYSDIIGEYESLAVDREFAETSYIARLAAYEGALAEAQRQSRYLAAYLEPTLPEKPLYPLRFLFSFLTALFLLFAWSVAVLIFYSVKDRR